MQSFQHIAPALRLFSGPDSLASLNKELERLGSQRAVIFCGPWAEGPLLDAVQSAIANRCAGVYRGVVAHSPIASVEEAGRELEMADADAVIALGGGSSIVTARAASILFAEQRDLRALCTSRDDTGRLRSPKLLAPKLPQLVVPTTPTTAMVKAGSAVFDPSTGERLALYDPKTRAQGIFIHPEFILSSPGELALSASLNTFSMAIEGLSSRSGDPISDGMLIQVLRLLHEHLPDAKTASDAEVRSMLVLAAVICGQGTDHTGAGITTVLGHAIGARHHLDNGLANATVLPQVIRFNGAAGEPGLQKVATAFGLRFAEGEQLLDGVVAEIESLLDRLKVPTKLRQIGVTRDSLPEIAANAISDWFLGGNPRKVSDKADLLEVLEGSW